MINNIRYADDTVVLAESKEHLQTLMKVSSVSSTIMGLETKFPKTKCLVLDRGTHVQNSTKIAIGNINIKNVYRYIYLGREVNTKKSSGVHCQHMKVPVPPGVTFGPYYGCETGTLKQIDKKTSSV